MRVNASLLACLVACVDPGASHAGTPPFAPAFTPRPPTGVFGEDLGSEFDFGGSTPLELLDHLERHVHDKVPYTLVHPQRDWIKPVHVPLLFEKIDSKRPCLAVKTPESSSLVRASTVGAEALRMIEAFRCNEYPPPARGCHPLGGLTNVRDWYRDWQSAPASKVTPRPQRSAAPPRH